MLLDPRLWLTATTLSLPAALSAYNKRVKVTGYDSGTNFVAAVFFLLLIWVPRPWRDLVLSLGICAAVWGISESLVAMGLTLALMGAAWYLVPGGLSVAFLGFIAVIIAWLEVNEHRQHYLRLRRMQKLVPGDPTELEVEITGVVRATRQLTLPFVEGPIAAYQVTGAAGSMVGEGRIHVETDAGAALVDVAEITLDVSDSKTLAGDEARKAEAELGIVPFDGEDGPRVSLRWLADGTEVCVFGVADWVKDASTGGYRGSSITPLFAAGSKLLDRSGAQLRTDSKFALVSWSLWLALISAIAIAQALA